MMDARGRTRRRDPHAPRRRDYAVRRETPDYKVPGETDADILRSWLGKRVVFRRCGTGERDEGILTEVGSLSATVTDDLGAEHANLLFQMGIELA